MRTRADVMKAKAERIAKGLPVEDEPVGEHKPLTLDDSARALAGVSPEAEPPKRRSRSSVAAASVPTHGSVNQSAIDVARTSVGLPADSTEELARVVTDDDKKDRLRQVNQEVDIEDMKAADLAMPPGYQRIVTHLFDLEEPMTVYEEVRESLRLATRASSASYGQLVDALDAAEENAMRAMDLLINAKDAHAAFEIDAKIIASGLRDHASAILEDKKLKKEISKAITNDDVEAVMAAKYPDEWLDIERKRGRAKHTIDLIAALHEAARERAKDLRALVSKYRGDS